MARMNIRWRKFSTPCGRVKVRKTEWWLEYSIFTLPFCMEWTPCIPYQKKKKKGHNNEAQSAHKEIDSNLDSTCLNPASSSFLFSTVTSLCDYWSFYLHSPITDMGMFLNLRFITLISVSDDGRLGKRKSTQCCRRWALEVRLDGRYHFSFVGLSFLIWQGFFMFCAFVNNIIMELIYLRWSIKE